MGTWLVWVGSFGMRGADEAGCHRGDGSLVFYWCLSLLESGPVCVGSLVVSRRLATWLVSVWSSGLDSSSSSRCLHSRCPQASLADPILHVNADELLYEWMRGWTDEWNSQLRKTTNQPTEPSHHSPLFLQTRVKPAIDSLFDCRAGGGFSKPKKTLQTRSTRRNHTPHSLPDRIPHGTPHMPHPTRHAAKRMHSLVADISHAPRSFLLPERAAHGFDRSSSSSSTSAAGSPPSARSFAAASHALAWPSALWAPLLGGGRREPLLHVLLEGAWYWSSGAQRASREPGNEPASRGCTCRGCTAPACTRARRLPVGTHGTVPHQRHAPLNALC